jgi:hypothetical protein
MQCIVSTYRHVAEPQAIEDFLLSVFETRAMTLIISGVDYRSRTGSIFGESDGHVANHHDIRSTDVVACVAGDETWTGQHVVIQQQDHLGSAAPDALVQCGMLTASAAQDRRQAGVPRLEGFEKFEGMVDVAVKHNEEFGRRRVGADCRNQRAQ